MATPHYDLSDPVPNYHQAMEPVEEWNVYEVRAFLNSLSLRNVLCPYVLHCGFSGLALTHILNSPEKYWTLIVNKTQTSWWATEDFKREFLEVKDTAAQWKREHQKFSHDAFGTDLKRNNYFDNCVSCYIVLM